MADPQFATMPAQGVVSITPSDSTVLSGIRGLYVGGAGNVAVTMADGSTGTYTAVAAGTTLATAPTKVMATNTTATNILGLR